MKQHPVLVALVTLEVTPDQVEEDAKWVESDGRSNPILTQSFLSKYPSVKEIAEAKTRFQEIAGRRRETIANQLALANSHAALFVYAEKTGANNRQLVSNILSDTQLREQALSLVRDDNLKTSAGEGLDLLLGMISDEKNNNL